MSDELEKAKARLTHGRLKLEPQKAHYAPLQSHFKIDPAKQSKKLIADMDATIAGMKEYLATLSRTPHH